ncbi:DinB family protein [Ectobacillus ponti]|uniref:DinB family protein n=1 Tax=Ectobacillus ponti TaxID=2961894 RepID=A0AA41X8D3_9BACI|nr:DinB family protein [Ectobacillus ponti]MCP8968569.1 DinB family protein [Ectobacillus ponti]
MKQRHEVLFTQLESYRGYLLGAVEQVTEEQAEVVPAGFRNNIRWNLGHIYLDQYLWIRALTKEEVPVPALFQDWFGYGTSPQSFTAETPSLQELKELLRQQPAQLRERYGHRLKEKFAPAEMGMRTIEQVIIRTIFHEGMHLQAILDLKKHIHTGQSIS